MSKIEDLVSYLWKKNVSNRPLSLFSLLTLKKIFKLINNFLSARCIFVALIEESSPENH